MRTPPSHLQKRQGGSTFREDRSAVYGYAASVEWRNMAVEVSFQRRIVRLFVRLQRGQQSVPEAVAAIGIFNGQH
jgi:hypothetical protein